MEKGRWHTSGSPTTLVVVLALVLSTFICLLLRLSGCPGPPEPLEEELQYLLVFPGNSTFAQPRLHKNDMSRLIDLRGFAFTMNNLVCNESSPLLLGLVHSDPLNVERRLSLRTTWASVQDENFKVLFLVGKPRNDSIQRQLEHENFLHHDIVQGNFHDAYRNLTYKHVMALKWVTYFCPKAKYILKTDDDVFVYTPGLVAYIRNSLSQLGARRLILCPAGNQQVIRSFRSKWRVSVLEYKPKNYPQYCSGFIVLYSPDVVFRLYHEAQYARYFWVDDVFITGILAAKANYRYTKIGKLLSTRKEFDDFLSNTSTKSDFLFGPMNLGVEEIRGSWEKMIGSNMTKKSHSGLS